MPDLAALRTLLAQEDWPRAEALLRRAAQSRAPQPEVYYNLAKVLEAAGKHGQRRVWLKKAIAARPGYATAWYELGRVELEDGMLQAALTAFQRALDLDPDDRYARRSLGRVALRLCQWDLAAQAFAGEDDPEAKATLYRIRAEQGKATAADRAELLADLQMRPDALKALTRVAKGTLPLRL